MKLSLIPKDCIFDSMVKPGMHSSCFRSHAAQLLLAALFFWSIFPLHAANGGVDFSRVEQRESIDRAQAYPLPAVADHRGKHSADQQLNPFARPPQEEFDGFERTLTAERATVVRGFTPFPAQVVLAQHMSSDL